MTTHSSKNFAFLAFLDLISCTFGAAVLIFVVAAASGQPQPGSKSAGMLIVYAKHLDGSQPELGFKVQRPDKVSFLTTDELGMSTLGAKTFSSAAEEGGVFCLIVPKPIAGLWRFTVYRSDGLAEADAKYQIEVFTPSDNGEQAVATVVDLPRGTAIGSKIVSVNVPP